MHARCKQYANKPFWRALARRRDVSANVAKTLRRALVLASSLQNPGAPPHAGRCFSCLARCCLSRVWPVRGCLTSVPLCLLRYHHAWAIVVAPRLGVPRQGRQGARFARCASIPACRAFVCGAAAVLPVAAAACALGHGSCHAGSCGATPSPPALLSQRECAAAASQASSTRTS
jgi:hypothetical protein